MRSGCRTVLEKTEVSPRFLLRQIDRQIVLEPAIGGDVFAWGHAGEGAELVAEVRLVGVAEGCCQFGPVGYRRRGAPELEIGRDRPGDLRQNLLEAPDARVLLGRNADPA